LNASNFTVLSGAVKLTPQGDGAMNSIKAGIASVVLMLGFFSAAATQTPVGDEKAPTVDRPMRGLGAAVVKTKSLNAADCLGAGTPVACSASGVTYINSEAVEASFAKGVGVQLHDGKAEGEDWALNTDDREAPAQVLSHAHTTEINIIVAGTATYVVGGTIVNPGKGHYPEDTNGTAIENGETYHLSKGDVIIVPKGVPHWFKEAHGFRYFLVRIRH
jgi:mannose-6-phosphate isomerase-like protein (cupin superfamily)